MILEESVKPWKIQQMRLICIDMSQHAMPGASEPFINAPILWEYFAGFDMKRSSRTLRSEGIPTRSNEANWSSAVGAGAEQQSCRPILTILLEGGV